MPAVNGLIIWLKWTEGFSVRNAEEKQERADRKGERPRFLVDGMLGSLARKLRIYGYDTLYLKSEDDQKLLEECTKQSRILLTSDKRLAEQSRKSSVSCIFVTGKNDLERLCQVFGKLGIKPRLNSADSRCPNCNGTLGVKPRHDVHYYVAQKSLERYDVFYFCAFCGKAYWEGSHWSKLESLDSHLRECLGN